MFVRCSYILVLFPFCAWFVLHSARAAGGTCVYVYTEIHRRGILVVNHFDYRVVLYIKGVMSNNYIDRGKDTWYNIGRAF